MSDEVRNTVPSAEALRLLFGAAGLAQLATMRADLARAAALAVQTALPPPSLLAELKRAALAWQPSPEVLRALASVGTAGRLADEMTRIQAGRTARLREIGRHLAERRAEDEDMRAAFRAWRASEQGRDFFVRLEESRRREETGGAEELDTIG